MKWPWQRRGLSKRAKARVNDLLGDMAKMAAEVNNPAKAKKARYIVQELRAIMEGLEDMGGSKSEKASRYVELQARLVQVLDEVGRLNQ